MELGAWRGGDCALEAGLITIRDMKKAGRRGRSETETGARIEVLETLAESHATPCARALFLLGCQGSRRRALAVFDGRANLWQVRDWRLGRRGMPQWAVDLLRAKLAQVGAVYDSAQSELAPGPGKGWNKNATRGLGEWRAKRNLEKS